MLLSVLDPNTNDGYPGAESRSVRDERVTACGRRLNWSAVLGRSIPVEVNDE